MLETQAEHCMRLCSSSTQEAQPLAPGLVKTQAGSESAKRQLPYLLAGRAG